jgi:alpha-galactosidase
MSKNIHSLTPYPPMGWNSYDSFGCFVNEERLLQNLNVFVERLKPHGYEYFVVDAGWYRNYDTDDREFPGKDDGYTVLFDEYSRPIPAKNFFPNGIKVVADACHAVGVKFGIHMMRGIPRAAVDENTLIYGTNFHAMDIADVSDTCSWCADNYGIDMNHPGAQTYYDSIIEMLAGWGIDFIKYDDIVPSPPEVNAVVNAIEKCSREIVLSLSPGNGHDEGGWPAYFRANMIRTSGDIWDDREDFRWVFERWEKFLPLIDKLPSGCWLDMDMIPFGELQVWNPSKGEQVGHILMNGKGSHRMSGLNEQQRRTFMTMRAMAASPLFMGGNLPGTDEYSFKLLTDCDMLECNQNGVTGKLIAYTDWTSTWLTKHFTKPDSGWFCVFNRDGDNPRDIKIDAEMLGISPYSRLYDIWKKADLGNFQQPLTMTLPPDEVLFVRYSKR